MELRTNIYQTTSKSSREVTEAEAKTLADAAGAAGGPNGVGASATYSCDTCGVDCTSVRYHSLKTKNFELCPPCYLDGRFPSSMFSGDFVKLTASQNSFNGDDDWTNQEILQLLEGVEMYDDDWSAIEEHVGTRSAQQCIRKFLELPIEDSYLEAESEASKGPLRYARLPFEQADNPVMSVVAFLSGVMGPSVAAEAAKTALHELTDGDKTDKEDVENEKGIEEEAATQKDTTDEEMSEHKEESNVGPSDDQEADAENEDDPMKVDGAASKPKPTIPHSRVQRAAKIALNASAKAASALADAEERTIRTSLAQLIKLTLTRLELKMAQFEEMEELLEDERRTLESQRMALASERQQLKHSLDSVRAEITKNQASGMPLTSVPPSVAQAVASTSQGTKVSEVHGDVPMGGASGPNVEGNFTQIG